MREMRWFALDIRALHLDWSLHHHKGALPLVHPKIGGEVIDRYKLRVRVEKQAKGGDWWE